MVADESGSAETALNKRFGVRMRALRQERSMTQADMVERLREEGISSMNASTLSRIETGERPAKLTEARAFQRVFRIDLETVLADDDALMFIESRHRQARQAYASFRGRVAEITKAQLKMADDREVLLSEELGGDLAGHRDHLIRNIESYLEIDLAAEAQAIASNIRRTWSEREGSPEGRFLNVTDGIH